MVDDPVDASGLWLSLGDLAAARGVSKQAISKNLKDWAGRGIVVATRMAGRSLLVNVAQYDRARGEVGHTVRDQQPGEELPAPRGGTASNDPVFAREQAREKAYAADLKKLDLGERSRSLVPLDRAIDEAKTVIAPLVLVLDRLPGRAEDLAAAVAEGGSQAARLLLKQIVVEIRNSMADAMSKLVATLNEQPRRPIGDFHPSDGAPAGQTEGEPDGT
jgi:biotin operon repressor